MLGNENCRDRQATDAKFSLLKALVAVPSILLVLAIGNTCNGKTRDPTTVTATITSYGRYKAVKLAEDKINQKTSGGVVVRGKNLIHIETTKIIPCRLGETWGFTVRFHNLPKDRGFVLRKEMHHPSIRQPNGNILRKSVNEKVVEVGMDPSGPVMWGFLEGYEYELVPGQWTRKMFIDNVEVVAMAFEVREIDKVEDPWEPLGLHPIETKVGTCYVDPALYDQREDIKAMLEKIILKYEAEKTDFTAIKKKKAEIIKFINNLLGFTPDEKEATTQDGFFRWLDNPFMTLAPKHSLRFNVVTRPLLVEHLRKGAKLPYLTYDEKTNKGRCTLMGRFSGKIGDKNTKEQFVRLESVPIVVKTSETAIQDVEEFGSKLLEGLLGASKGQYVFILHELIEATIVHEMLRPSGPHWRWFSDGLSNAIVMEVLDWLDETEVAQENAKWFDATQYEDIRQEVNLQYWLATDYDIKSPIKSEKRLENARYAYATLEMRRLIKKHGIGIVRDIMRHAGTRAKQSPEDLITAIQEAGGEDIAQRLSRYQQFSNAEEGVKIYSHRYKQALEKKNYHDIFVSNKRIAEILFRTQYPDKRYFLAAGALGNMGNIESGAEIIQKCIEREAGTRKEDIWQKYLIKYALTFNNPSLAYDVASDLVKHVPPYGPAQMIHIHRLRSEGRVQDALRLGEQLRLQIEDFKDEQKKKKFLKWLNNIEQSSFQ